ncbi:MAG: class I SAM-dependent methyltransferase [Candidatus Altiarchaeota archaeon]|nr:class I SAM-dependent methyltransferase [Candidatus Altiarchaeota archaeon]
MVGKDKLQTNRTCPNCKTNMESKITNWTFFCRNCGLWTSNLGSKENRLLREMDVSQKDRIKGLHSIRLENATITRRAFEKHDTLHGKTLCDVGSGYGWFNQVFEEGGAQVLGIEPEKIVAKQARVKTRIGYFPNALKRGERFDIISFNDVFEHMNHPSKVLEEVHKRLNKKGKLIVSVPSSGGLFYRLIPVFHKLGYREPWNRLWQCEFNSPHVLYFNSNNLKALIEKKGFRQIDKGRLKTFELRGLKNRINTGKGTGKIISCLLFAVLVLTYPLINYIFPSDSIFQIFEKV